MKLKLGIDFDNTIVIYDNLFYEIALGYKLIPSSLSKSKKAVRKFLIEAKQEDKFTDLQSEVYGKYILRANPAEGIFSAIKSMISIGIDVSIISHKTKYPYAGKQYDLHSAALSWLDKNLFLSNHGLSIPQSKIFFEPTKEKKVARIISESCTHYVDDLPSILNMIDPNVVKILFSQTTNSIDSSDYINKSSWKEIEYFMVREFETSHG